MLVLSLLVDPVTSAAQQTPQYGHAYYLFIAPPADSCKACYIPLLVTVRSLEDIARTNQDQDSVVITTYERDSIWALERGVSVSPGDIRPQERHVRLQGQQYRYQEVGAAEVLRLLEHPEGTIPIHRTAGPPSREALRDLVESFRALK